MSIDRAVLAFAGFMVLLSLALTAWVSAYFVWLTEIGRASCRERAFSGFCPAAAFFKWFGIKPGKAF